MFLQYGFLFSLTLWLSSYPVSARRLPLSMMSLYFEYLFPDNCGLVKQELTIKNRILGGEEAKIGEMPWIAILGYKSPYATSK
ncbi:hypothetical protein M8J76_000165 [Diaphorina citri]|nr:hypothetical protein M8J75_007629 [Diaphorina citri]KAI5740064.1 hypothetical protein M8J76_000165 [Diaphorina citri]KAI5746858.1 hypothetical protein M8J77_008255 [Diaphorina citri]